LNVHDYSNDNGQPLLLWSNASKPETQWYIKDIGEGKFNIMNAKSKKCVNISGHGLKDGTKIIQWDNPESWETRWRITFHDDHYIIESVFSKNEYLNTGHKTDNGAEIQTHHDTSDLSTQWIIKPAVKGGDPLKFDSTQLYTLETKLRSGEYLHVHDASIHNGTTPELRDNPKQLETHWHLKNVGGDNFTIMNARSKKYVNFSGDTKVVQLDNPDSSETRWKITFHDDHRRIESVSAAGEFLTSADGQWVGAPMKALPTPLNWTSQWIFHKL